MQNTVQNGLTTAQAEQSRQRHGSNVLTRKKRLGFFRQYLKNFGDPIIKVLLAALAINILFMFHRFDWFETVGIAVAVFLATFVSTLSEYGSEAAFEKLQQDASHIRCRVRRDGRIVLLPIDEVVVGDLITLSAGERIPADGLLISGRLLVDQSALNGESAEVTKVPGEVSDDSHLSSKSNVFRGTVISDGEGCMLVQKVGDRTFYGHVASELQEETRESPLKVRLAGLAKTISRLGYIAAACVLLADLFYSFVISNQFDGSRILAQLSQPAVLFSQVFHAITLAITVVVVAVPEGLPMMITVVLSSNMRRMLRDKVLVRKLVGIETSGSLNILFTDKTGTLTKGKLEVSGLVSGAGKTYRSSSELRRCKPLWNLISLSCQYNNESQLSGRKILGGNATDRALMAYVKPFDPDIPRYSLYSRLPFSSARKYSAADIGAAGQPPLHLLKGAPEFILPACTKYVDEKGDIRPLTSGTHLKERWDAMTAQSMRVLALALSDVPLQESTRFSSLTLIGLIGIRDELRPEAFDAVGRIRNAGIQVVMITGDNRDTAAAIARSAGLLEDNAPPEAVLTSQEFAALTDDQVKKRLPQLRVLARALPTDKSRLIHIAQETGRVAGMTGDGINDAPALKKADVGFAMGSGTEVAKEAGDVVILDDNIASIARAVLYGRTIFKSIRKFIVFQLTMNLCAVGISILGPFIGIDTPVTVVQMLWINIIMDTLAGLAFAGEPPLEEYMREPPKRREEPVINRYMAHQILFTGLFTIGLCVAFLKLDLVKSLFRYDTSPIFFMTAFFALFIFCGIFNCFNARTHRLNLLAHLHKNLSFTVIMAAVSAVQLLLIYFGGTLFRTAGLTLRELWTILRMAFLVVPVDCARKILLRLFHRKGSL